MITTYPSITMIYSLIIPYKHRKKKRSILRFSLTAGDRGRTGTGITTHGILSPGRLPVPQKPLYIYISWDYLTSLLMGL